MQRNEEDFIVINTRLDLPVSLHEGYKALWEANIDALIATSDQKERAFHEHLYPFSSFVRQKIKFLLSEIAAQHGKTNDTQRRCAKPSARTHEEAGATCERAG